MSNTKRGLFGQVVLTENPWEYKVSPAPQVGLNSFTVQVIADNLHKEGWELLSFIAGKVISRRKKK